MTEPEPTSDETRAELAAMYALGALDGKSFAQVQSCLGCPVGELSKAVDEYEVLVAAMSQSLLPQIDPPAEAKAEIDQMLGFDSPEKESEEPTSEPTGFTYLLNDEGEWRPLPVAKGGARVKELSNDPASGFTVMLLELDPETRFPSHRHHGIEETFLISGDLRMQDRVLAPGDYARALPGSRHSALYSENGCRALVVTASENYPKQTVRAYGALHKALDQCKKLFGGDAGKN